MLEPTIEVGLGDDVVIISNTVMRGVRIEFMHNNTTACLPTSYILIGWTPVSVEGRPWYLRADGRRRSRRRHRLMRVLQQSCRITGATVSTGVS